MRALMEEMSVLLTCCLERRGTIQHCKVCLQIIIVTFHSNKGMTTNLPNVTGPVKTGYVGTNFTPSHNKSFLSTVTEYLWSVTCTIKPMLNKHYCHRYHKEKLSAMKLKKVVEFNVFSYPLFAGPVRKIPTLSYSSEKILIASK